ncbi:MAG: conjugal transfer protein TraF, partial [Woeseiaceae bacterium]
MKGPIEFSSQFWPRAVLSALLVSPSLMLPMPAMAGTTFGSYDARTLAMGSTSVASATNGNAQFYNPALLAFNTEIEERTQDARFYFPLLISHLSESAITMDDIARQDPELLISRAIDEFNVNPNQQSARSVVNAVASFDASLADLEDEDLFADIYIGTGGGEAGLFQGAGFFFGARILAGGESAVTAEDRALLETYQEGLTFIASNGTQGVAHPELFDANGQLIDPNNAFNSTASASGAIV